MLSADRDHFLGAGQFQQEIRTIRSVVEQHLEMQILVAQTEFPVEHCVCNEFYVASIRGPPAEIL